MREKFVIRSPISRSNARACGMCASSPCISAPSWAARTSGNPIPALRPACSRRPALFSASATSPLTGTVSAHGSTCTQGSTLRIRNDATHALLKRAETQARAGRACTRYVRMLTAAARVNSTAAARKESIEQRTPRPPAAETRAAACRWACWDARLPAPTLSVARSGTSRLALTTLWWFGSMRGAGGAAARSTAPRRTYTPAAKAGARIRSGSPHLPADPRSPLALFPAPPHPSSCSAAHSNLSSLSEPAVDCHLCAGEHGQVGQEGQEAETRQQRLERLLGQVSRADGPRASASRPGIYLYMPMPMHCSMQGASGS